MGTVFEALDEKMHRHVALKLLSRHVSSSERAGERFAREAWIGGKLNHPNLVRVYDRGEHEELSFYSMELVDGGSLYDVIRKLKQWNKDDTWGLEFGSREYITWAITQIVAAARGLDYAHRQGVVHRDIKPMNILLSKEPCTVKIADFGLAVDMTATRLTTAGKIMGTVAYMAPEQIRGRHDEIDGRADVYSLAVSLFELLTLELPFTGETQQLYLNAVLTSAARRPSKLNERVSRDLEIVLHKALEKSPRDRYASAAAFAEDLENVLHFRPISARPPNAVTRVAKWARRQPYIAGLAAVLIIAIPTVSILYLVSVRQQGRLDRIENERRMEAARRLSHDGRDLDALRALTQVLDIDPENLDTLQHRALSYHRLGKQETDQKRRQELQDLALSDVGRIIALQPRLAWPYRVRAFILKEIGRTDEAGADEQAARGLASPEPAEQDSIIDGILARQGGDHARAVQAFTEAIRRRADSVDALLNRAESYEALGDGVKAVRDLEIVAALQPSSAYPRHALGRLLTAAGSLAEGEQQIQEALTREPVNAEIHQTHSDNLVRQGRAAVERGDSQGALVLFERAGQAAREAKELNPDLPWAHVNLGASLMERNRLLPSPDRALIREAIGEFQTVIARGEGKANDIQGKAYASALVNQCDALIQAADYQLAAEICQSVARREPSNPINHYNLAGVYALLHRADEALASLQKDFELGDRDYQYLASDMWFVSLHGDPRFETLLEKMKTTPDR